MRIKSDFKDYYDCMMKYGADDAITFIRKQETIPLEKKIYSFSSDCFGHPNFKYIDRNFFINVVGFCGQTYLYRIENIKYGEYKFVYLDKDDFPFLHIEQTFFDKSPIWVVERTTWGYDRVPLNRTYKHVKDKFEYKYWDKYELHINPCLKAINFEREKSPHEAFEELYKWFSNMAMPEKPIPHISDEIMAEAKGFNKFSFRKDAKENAKRSPRRKK